MRCLCAYESSFTQPLILSGFIGDRVHGVHGSTHKQKQTKCVVRHFIIDKKALEDNKRIQPTSLYFFFFKERRPPEIFLEMPSKFWLFDMVHNHFKDVIIFNSI